MKAQRARDICALLATLFASRGTIMLTAGDEFGRTQKGNNNAYAQDNELTWLDWAGRDQALEEFAFALAAIRKAAPALAETALPDRRSRRMALPTSRGWTRPASRSSTRHGHDPERQRLSMVLANGTAEGGRLAVMINGDRRGVSFALPVRDEFRWKLVPGEQEARQGRWPIAGRTVALAIERAGNARGMR